MNGNDDGLDRASLLSSRTWEIWGDFAVLCGAGKVNKAVNRQKGQQPRLTHTLSRMVCSATWYKEEERQLTQDVCASLN